MLKALCAKMPGLPTTYTGLESKGAVGSHHGGEDLHVLITSLLGGGCVLEPFERGFCVFKRDRFVDDPSCHSVLT